MFVNMRKRILVPSLIGAGALALTAIPVSVSISSSDGLLSVSAASAAQPQSGQPGNTEGKSGRKGPAPGQRGGGGKQHNNGN